MNAQKLSPLSLVVLTNSNDFYGSFYNSRNLVAGARYCQPPSHSRAEKRGLSGKDVNLGPSDLGLSSRVHECQQAAIPASSLGHLATDRFAENPVLGHQHLALFLLHSRC